ncbi:hypothetical protein CGZ98_11805 [Enemella evansiae]|uniref:hypothetical protein n=1 Tax=Enemella evansiae TaxID=2016499 RepID=UPI000B960DF7|nr:hypothetical protein [Enemella evansiae]OYO09815.1 hypothetical protein CGZ98_11805 [Enemella evansiae]
MGRTEQLELGSGSRWWQFLLAFVLVAGLVAAGVQAYARRLDPPTPPAQIQQPQTPTPTPTRTRSWDPDRSATRNLLYRWQFPDGFTCWRFEQRDRVPRGERVAYLESLVRCLATLHDGPMGRMRRQVGTIPRLVVEGRDPIMICPTTQHADWGAVYCAVNQTITYRLPPPEEFDEDPSADEFLIAHEYAHHLQAISGIWVSASSRFAGEEAFGRRIELQATCMAGALVAGSWSPIQRPREVRQRDLDSLARWPADWASTHGTPEARRTWARAGMTGPWYSGCNTWRVPTEQVR